MNKLMLKNIPLEGLKTLIDQSALKSSDLIPLIDEPKKAKEFYENKILTGGDYFLILCRFGMLEEVKSLAESIGGLNFNDGLKEAVLSENVDLLKYLVGDDLWFSSIRYYASNIDGALETAIKNKKYRSIVFLVEFGKMAEPEKMMNLFVENSEGMTEFSTILDKFVKYCPNYETSANIAIEKGYPWILIYILGRADNKLDLNKILLKSIMSDRSQIFEMIFREIKKSKNSDGNNFENFNKILEILLTGNPKDSNLISMKEILNA